MRGDDTVEYTSDNAMSVNLGPQTFPGTTRIIQTSLCKEVVLEMVFKAIP